MNEYGEIIRNSTPLPPIPSSPGNKNHNKSGVALMVGILILIIVIACIANASRNKKQANTGNDSQIASSVYSKEKTTTIDDTLYVEDAWLTDLDYIKMDNINIRSDSIGRTNTGEEYSHYMFARSPYSEIVYNLNGNYDTLTAIWTICEQNKDTDDNNSFEIYADNELVFESPTITRGDLPVNVNINIKNCNLLTILFKEGTGGAELGDIYLSNKSEKKVNADVYVPQELPCWLTDLEYLTNDGVYINADSVGKTNTGEQYSHYMFARSEGSEIVYYLNGKYTSLSGLWAICEQNKDTDDNNSFEIYADDMLVYLSSTLTGGDIPEKFNVDINNCEKLRIKFTSGGGAGELSNLRIYPSVNAAPINTFVSKDTEGKRVWLTDFDYLTNDGVYVYADSTGTTNTGEEYSHYMFAQSEGGEIIYYLKGNYKQICGLWTICQQNRNTTDRNSFEIYADDQLVYTSPSLTGGDLPITFNVEINNCQKLKICFIEGRGSGELGNVFVY